ncbi:MAG: type III secretion system translocon subunit SctE [Bilophila sp.]|uniref:type III secretion system translocon subunit SctE n=1 Tax=uncultured Bilophila sp. TaxID=529385 RepID=UPI00266FA753|nr:type III secretion system translocon subunit SctE [uncultured Bilophila sp.]MBS6141383.1 type III secretion system translocon subunit SctE [Bilophila sp.]
MPNAIDFQIGSKFMDLIGGADMENLPDAIKRALEGITLPDVPASSPDASSPAGELPTLPAPMPGCLSLETLAQMISNEVRTQATKDGVASIEAKGKERAEINQKKLEEIMDRLESMKSKGILDIFKKIFSWVGVVLGAIASVATIAAGAATGNPLLIAGGAVMLTMSLNSILSMATDGKVSIGAGIAAGLEALGVREDIAAYTGMAFELAITLVGVGLTMGGSFGSAAETARKTLADVADITLKVTNISSSVVQMGSGATGIAGAVYDYKISNSYADTKLLEAVLERLRQALEVEQDFMKGVVERAGKLNEDVNELVEGCNESLTNVLTSAPPAMA